MDRCSLAVAQPCAGNSSADTVSARERKPGWKSRITLASIPLMALLGSGTAQAQLMPDQEYAKYVDKAKSVKPMTEFGEQVNPRDGNLLVRATDVELPGIGPTIRITRTYRPNRSHDIYRETSGNGFGEWELEIPRIKTITSNTAGVKSTSPKGWQVSGSTDAYRNQRCTNFAAPGDIAFTSDAARYWRPYEWWDGYYVVDDRGGDQALMSRNSAAPTPGYPLMTMGNWLVNCLSATANAQAGEAFYAVAPDGTKYWFNYLVYVQADTLQKPLWSVAPPALMKGGSTESATASKLPGDDPQPQLVAGNDFLDRRYASMLVTRVEDRFGNYLTYNYSNGRLSSIDASDGRHVGISFDASGRISTITAGSGTQSRTWTYSYNGSVTGTAALTVTRPDQSTWQYSLPVLTASDLAFAGDASSCSPSPNDYTYSISGTIKSPAGATLTLNFGRKRFTRSYVPKQCWGGDPADPNSGYAMYPREWYAWALTNRTVTGPGLPSMSWNYDYSPPVSSWYQDCPTPTSCASTVWSDVTNPQGERRRSIFSNKFDETEGKLLRDEVYSATGQLLRATDHAYATVGAGIIASPYPWPLSVGSDKRQRVNNLTQGRWAPERQTIINQDGVSFTRNVDTFDSYARAATVTRIGPGSNRSETTTYADNTSLWVLGQIDTVVSNGLTVVDNDYFPSTALLSSTRKFGVLQVSYTYNANGTLATQADAAGHTVSLSNYKLGIPRSISYPTGVSESAVVDDLGQVTSDTGVHGYTTTYGYDAIGRLSSITPPAGFTATTLSFAPASSAEYGLPTGHWRQTTVKGNAVTETYYDGLWRPVLTHTYDTANPSGTSKTTVKQYDADGRSIYASYPINSVSTYNSTPDGVWTSYDSLGRETQKIASSELGNLTTSTAYLTGFLTQTTNPRGYITTQSFWAEDNPGKAQLASASAPEGFSLNIGRDAFGKPTSITRSGGGMSVTRSYVYEPGQRLCKTVEPEIGATIQTYDSAGNVAWRAPGQGLTSTSTCDDASVPAAGKISYGYDNLNRLTSTTYGDTSPGVSRTYTADGLPLTVVSNGSTWTYDYNELRKLKTETFNYAGNDFVFTRGYNLAGNLASLSYPSSVSVTYNPNALGEPTTVGGYASSIAFHPNGAVANYTLGNTVAHSLTLNTRGLPWVNQDAGVIKDTYSYDQNGNVTGITDGQEGGATSRSMGYDGLDRLTTANSPGIWGSASYTYDALDNITTATVGSRSTTMGYDASNKLTSLNVNGTVSSIGYDARGNVLSKGGQYYAFDLGNRMGSASLAGNYAYDGEGRRFMVQSSDGSTRLSLYSQAGQLLWSTSTGGTRPASSTAYIYLGTKQIAEWNSASGTQYVHTDGLGSPVAHTSASPSWALLNRSRFEPYGYVAQGTRPGASTSLVGFTGHVQDAETDLVYMQQRYYDPIAGRFLSVDPVVTDANTGKGFGPYVYVDNNPYSKIDPDGRDPEPLQMGDCGYIKSLCQQDGGAPSAPSWRTTAREDGAYVSNVLEQKFDEHVSEGAMVLFLPLFVLREYLGVPRELGEYMAEPTVASTAVLIVGMTGRGGPIMHGHHPWPKYLGGPKIQYLQQLPKAVHDAYHSGLDKILPRQRGAAYYESLSPTAKLRVERYLAEYTKAFDAKYGTKLYQSMVDNGFPAR